MHDRSNFKNHSIENLRELFAAHPQLPSERMILTRVETVARSSHPISRMASTISAAFPGPHTAWPATIASHLCMRKLVISSRRSRAVFPPRAMRRSPRIDSGRTSV